MEHRLNQVRIKLAESKLDAILITQDENRRYLSGFTGSAGYLVISAEHAIIITDFRYHEQSRYQAPNFRLVKMDNSGICGWMTEVLSLVKPHKLGFEAGNMTFDFYTRLRKILSEVDSDERPRLMSTGNFVESLRVTKEVEELHQIEKAAHIADAALEQVIPTIRSGMTEKQLAWELERSMREHGADSVSFDVIVASGPNSAIPHHRPEDRIIKEGEPIIIDMGAKVDGYCSDITRTITLGTPDETLIRIYDTVLAAQLTAIATVTSGMNGGEADNLARNIIQHANYGSNFGHSLGHGIGLAVHENPRVGPNSQHQLETSMVFTIEPGIYLPGWGGVRIEDMVVLENSGTRVITKSPKSMD